jgi:uncharacterized protein YdcH (DUF465 family)
VSTRTKEVEHLNQLHDVLGMQLELLTRRGRLTAREELQVKHIKQRKLQVKDRLARARWQQQLAAQPELQHLDE